jgi:hypothetical protein
MRWWTFVFLSLLVTYKVMAKESSIYGYVEKVRLIENDLTVSAKLDTGAKSASLSAIKITEVMIGDTAYLKFLVPTKKGNIPFTCEYAGKVEIKTRQGESTIHSLLKSTIKRPVVKLQVELDGKKREIFVNLTNRKNFLYPLLLGRDAIIAFDGIVNPNLKFAVKHKNIIKITSSE